MQLSVQNLALATFNYIPAFDNNFYLNLNRAYLQQPYNLLEENGLSSIPMKAPTFSIRKVKAHSGGIKATEKADMLAQMGQQHT
jgi:hypothetical protein